MTPLKIMTAPLACALTAAAMLCAGTAVAGTINTSSATPHVSTLSANNKVISVKHSFGVIYDNNDKVSCGARLAYSDDIGAAKNITLTQSTTPKQVVVERLYKSPGTYKVTLSGYGWGNYKPCSGTQISSAEILVPVTGAPPKLPASDIVESTQLTKIVLKNTEYSPGSISLYSTIYSNKTYKSCTVDFTVTTLNGGTDPINSVLMKKQWQAQWFTSSSDFNPGLLDINTTGKYRVTVTASNTNGLPCHGTASADFEVKRMKLNVGAALPPKLIKITLANTEFSPGVVELIANVQSDKPGASCQFNASVFTNNSGSDAINAQIIGPLNFNFSLPASAQKLPLGNLSVGKYRMTLTALKAENAACRGEASVDFEVKRKKLYVGTVEPGTITGLVYQSQTSLKEDSAHQDEALLVAVNGDVSNDYDKSKQCGWTMFLVNSEGKGKPIATGYQFTASQTIAAGALSGFAPGQYTLHVKSSAKDDGLANVSCKGEANKKITLLYSPGTITDVKLKSYGHHVAMAQGSIFNPAHDDGVLEIIPVINGPQCNYRVTRTVAGKGDFVPAIHVPGTSDKQTQVKYSGDKTFVTVTVHAVGTDNIANMGCIGSVSKTIVVRDDPSLPAVTQ